jgi:dienelactone hydrolase
MRYFMGVMSILAVLCLIGTACQKKEISGKVVEYTSGDSVFRGYLSHDLAITAKRPGILVVHEWWGQNEFIRKRTDMLADAGYVALAVDMYGDGKEASNKEEAAQLAKTVMEDPELLRERFLAALNFLKNHQSVDPERIAAIGYSFGGTTVLRMARSGLDLRGVVSFYGGLSATEPEQFVPAKAKILVLHGAKDWYVTAHHLTQFKIEMKKTHTNYGIISYEEAKHGFSNPDADTLRKKFNMKLEYSEEADRKSWKDMENFLDRIFTE